MGESGGGYGSVAAAARSPSPSTEPSAERLQPAATASRATALAPKALVGLLACVGLAAAAHLAAPPRSRSSQQKVLAGRGVGAAAAGALPRNPPHSRELKAYLGTTPTIDGELEPGEWGNAFSFSTSQPSIGSTDAGPNLWTGYFQNVTDAVDSSLVGWTKRSATTLYFAFNVTDNFLFAIDGPRWCPSANAGCTPLNQSGWPWFGDEIEILINAAPGGMFTGNRTCEAEVLGNGPGTCAEVVGNATQWQMVTSLTKSRLGGIGVGGLLEGEPRDSPSAWKNYQGWIESGAMKSAAKPRPPGSAGSRGYGVPSPSSPLSRPRSIAKLRAASYLAGCRRAIDLFASLPPCPQSSSGRSTTRCSRSPPATRTTPACRTR